MAAICDSSPLIVFGRARRLALLRRLFTPFIIPAGVRDEVLASDSALPGAEAVARASRSDLGGREPSSRTSVR